MFLVTCLWLCFVTLAADPGRLSHLKQAEHATQLLRHHSTELDILGDQLPNIVQLKLNWLFRILDSFFFWWGSIFYVWCLTRCFWPPSSLLPDIKLEHWSRLRGDDRKKPPWGPNQLKCRHYISYFDLVEETKPWSMPAGQGIHCNQQLQRSKIVELVLENFPLSWHGTVYWQLNQPQRWKCNSKRALNWALRTEHCNATQCFWQADRDADLMPDIR